MHWPAGSAIFRTPEDMLTGEIKSDKIEKLKFPKEWKMEILIQYKDFFDLCQYDVYTLLYFFGEKRVRLREIYGIEYNKIWCQDALDFAFRVIKIGFMGIDYPDDGPTSEELNDIFEQMSQSSPNEADGGAIWSTYQLYLTEQGQHFLDAWLRSGDDNLYGHKLIDIFNANDVGFDKHAFYPVEF